MMELASLDAMIPHPTPHAPRPTRHGYTLIEMMIATAISLMLMGAVVTMFARIAQSITASRAMLESADRLRLAASRMQQDLGGVTVDLSKVWHKPEDNEGYFEYVEGPAGPIVLPSSVARMTDASLPTNDTTVGDFDDILMFTTRSSGKPFVGRVPTAIDPRGIIESDVAEVAWFLRGRTLYRRTLLVAPQLRAQLAPISVTGFYANYDVSVRKDDTNTFVVPNTLGDLTKRENRIAHDATAFPYTGAGCICTWASRQPNQAYPVGAIVTPPSQNGRSYLCVQAGTCGGATEPPWPTDGNTVADGDVFWQGLSVFRTLPTFRECSLSNWVVGTQPLAPVGMFSAFDFWSNNSVLRASEIGASRLPLRAYTLGQIVFAKAPNDRIRYYQCTQAGTSGTTEPGWTTVTGTTFGDGNVQWKDIAEATRITEDAILTNVIGFDVKAWDPQAAAYVDLGSSQAMTFASGDYQTKSGFTSSSGYIYDTWPTHYEFESVTGVSGTPGQGFNGLDDGGGTTGIVDDVDERRTSPPYPVPLRGIQVKIRVFEPDSRDVREVTVVQDFLPQ